MQLQWGSDWDILTCLLICQGLNISAKTTVAGLSRAEQHRA